MKKCEHMNFSARVEVQRLTDGEGGAVLNFLADITVRCAECDIPFHFVGMAANTGLSFKHPTANVGATELHAPIAPGEGPLPSRIRFEVS